MFLTIWNTTVLGDFYISTLFTKCLTLKDKFPVPDRIDIHPPLK